MHDPWWWLIMYQFPINMEMWLTFWLEQPTGVGSPGSGGRQAEAHVVNKSPSGGRGKRGEFDGWKTAMLLLASHLTYYTPVVGVSSRELRLTTTIHFCDTISPKKVEMKLNEWMFFLKFDRGFKPLACLTVECPNTNLGDFPTWWADVTCNPPPWSGKWQGKIHCWFEAVSIHVGKVEKLTFVSIYLKFDSNDFQKLYESIDKP